MRFLRDVHADVVCDVQRGTRSLQKCDARGAVFAGVCEAAGVPFQKFVNRSDVRGGTTIGPVTAANLTIPVIDMGAPVLGMHSIRELASVKDNYYTVKAFTEFFSL